MADDVFLGDVVALLQYGNEMFQGTVLRLCIAPVPGFDRAVRSAADYRNHLFSSADAQEFNAHRSGSCCW